jgi:hypothetical protein
MVLARVAAGGDPLQVSKRAGSQRMPGRWYQLSPGAAGTAPSGRSLVWIQPSRV